MKADNSEMEKSIEVWLGDDVDQRTAPEYLDDMDKIYAHGPDEALMETAQRRLAETLKSAREEAVYYDVLKDTPVGQVLVAMQSVGIVAVEIGMSERDFIEYVSAEFGEPVLASKDALNAVMTQLSEYFLGLRKSFDLPLSLRQLTQFQRDVLEATIEIESGNVSTYGEIAHQLGKGRAARAVGQALARNPIPIIIPCHRVLGSDGALHGYSGGRGIETKRHLLQLEGAQIG
jgi:methylated-DNA-[protein]-cysteine S-methyltransferase